jgi:hypothetical protein
MTIYRLAMLPVLAVLALVLIGAGPSVGDRIAAAQEQAPAVPGPCADDRAVLIATGAADGVLFRCVGGVPLQREGPWSTPGCEALDYLPETTLLAVPGTAWQPGSACLVATPRDAGSRSRWTAGPGE